MTKKTIPIRDEDDPARTGSEAPHADEADRTPSAEGAEAQAERAPEAQAERAPEAQAERAPEAEPVVESEETDDAASAEIEDATAAEASPDESAPSSEAATVGVDPAVVARLLAENERLKRALDEKDQLLQKYISAYKKAEAEFARAKARIEGDVTRQVESARGDLARRLLGVLDDLERSLTAARGANGNLGALLEGVEMVYKSFLGRLGELGVERYDPANQAFDPGLHEAMGVVPVPDPAQNNRVLQVYAVGYRQGDQILRPARVIVGKHAG